MPNQTSSNFFVINLIIRKANDPADLTSEMYGKLFREFYESESSGQSSKEKEALLITNAEYTVEKGAKIFFGQFVEYTNIDRRKWFNLLKKDIDNEFTVPNHLKANSIKNYYFFIPDIHRFCYSYTSKEKIEPQNVQSYLNSAFTKFLTKTYGNDYYPEVNFEKEKETIQEIINAAEVFSLDITVTYSNDFGKQMKEFFDEDMRNGNVDDYHIIAKNKNKESLNLSNSKILRGALENSASLGKVIASIRNGKQRKIIRTADHPAKYKPPVPAIPESIINIYKFFINLF